MGESTLAAWVEREVGSHVIALYDRVILGTRKANIDHLFVAPTDVWVVDAKVYRERSSDETSGRSAATTTRSG